MKEAAEQAAAAVEGEGAAAMAVRLREAVLARPETILADRDLMRALVAGNDRALGENVIDMRGLAMERLEARLDRLEDTHRTVLAAAYENLAGMNQIHRAVLRLMEAGDFADFLRLLGGDVATILKVDSLRLALESHTASDAAASVALGRKGAGQALVLVGAGFAETYLAPQKPGARPVHLRRADRVRAAALFGAEAAWLGSEALMPVDLGPGRLPALLALGASDPDSFATGQGTDLLAFLAGAVERAFRFWLD